MNANTGSVAHGCSLLLCGWFLAGLELVPARGLRTPALKDMPQRWSSREAEGSFCHARIWGFASRKAVSYRGGF